MVSGVAAGVSELVPARENDSIPWVVRWLYAVLGAVCATGSGADSPNRLKPNRNGSAALVPPYCPLCIREPLRSKRKPAGDATSALLV